MISELVYVQSVLGWTMLVADWTDKSRSYEMFRLHMDSHRGGSGGAELTLSAAPPTVIQAIQHFLDGLSHLFKTKTKNVDFNFIKNWNLKNYGDIFRFYIETCELLKNS